ncbi:MAG: major capsid protein [Oceanospirillaceae bacterium]|nr:major capsid protein [Oceanospirillaceae bacterium]
MDKDLFEVTKLTAAMNALPEQITLTSNLKLFKAKPIKTTGVKIRLVNQRLELVPNTPRKGDPVPASKRDSKTVILEATHLPLSDVLLPDDIQNLGTFGTEGKFVQMVTVINECIGDMKDQLVLTREHLRIGALSGVVMDADGTTIIADLYELFKIIKKPVYKMTADAIDDGRAIHNIMKKGLGGTYMRGAIALCTTEFFNAFLAKPDNKKAYIEQSKKRDTMRDLVNEVTIGGVRYIEYNVSVGDYQFIKAGKARAFPLANVYLEAMAPANYNEAVNTLGKAFYAKAEARGMGKGYDIEAQANPFPFCNAPGALIELSY